MPQEQHIIYLNQGDGVCPEWQTHRGSAQSPLPSPFQIWICPRGGLCLTCFQGTVPDPGIKVNTGLT
ncbi:hypothetical protein AAFF_G00023690 [Aldrovandia affinis]|uniref:Uncharacterized protein n=1 Tax=Aldrovandia affinis TaxID=143900 RepID=A0AAD7T768_9TELE|nr:hypothetical protein AAFF_G00023690 [Aldrovandia affinis]